MQLLYEGKKKESLPLAIAGVGTVAAHAGGILGDFFIMGRNTVKESVEMVADVAGYEDFDAGASPFLLVPTLYFGWKIGKQLFGLSYRASKIAANTLLDYVNKE